MEEDIVPEQLPLPGGDIWGKSEFHKYIEKILSDKEVEKKLKDFPLWCVTSKDLKLTFFDNMDVFALENLFEAEVCRYLRSLPPSKHKPEIYLKLGQARIIFLANLRRSLGTSIQKMNERIAQLTQIKQIGMMESKQPSLLGRIFGRR
ncbi:hypothetical protein DRJ16_00055 [Candidatus Woesearchaeota archaeon]|nr:MAG: hypothetical protein DRJ16_00055 [Candidatus Woesearchaeota archaeon]